jgi:hypothetical protein
MRSGRLIDDLAGNLKRTALGRDDDEQFVFGAKNPHTPFVILIRERLVIGVVRNIPLGVVVAVLATACEERRTESDGDRGE